MPSRISYRRYTPAVANQGPLGTCVGWAIGYGQLTTQQNIIMGETRYQQRSMRAMDPAFVFGLIRDNNDAWCQEGASMGQAMKVLLDYGNKPKCFKPLMRCNETTRYSDFCMNVASMYKIDGVYRINNADMVSEMKEALQFGYTISIGVELTSSFKSGSTTLDGNWRPSYNEVSTGGHAMLIVGFDDYRNGGSFEVLNSWGTEFGDNGFVWIKYSDMKKRCKEAYVMNIGDSYDSESCSYGDCANTYSRYRYSNSKLDVYEGQITNNKPHIYGSMIYSNGDVYVGAWSNGRKHGWGISFIRSNRKWYLQSYSNDNLLTSETMGFAKNDDEIKFLKSQCETLQDIFTGELIEDPDSDEFIQFIEEYEVPANPVVIGG